MKASIHRNCHDTFTLPVISASLSELVVLSVTVLWSIDWQASEGKGKGVAARWFGGALNMACVPLVSTTSTFRMLATLATVMLSTHTMRATFLNGLRPGHHSCPYCQQHECGSGEQQRNHCMQGWTATERTRPITTAIAAVPMDQDRTETVADAPVNCTAALHAWCTRMCLV